MKLIDAHTHTWGSNTAELPWQAGVLPPAWHGSYTREDLVILDEPTSALSVEATALVHETVRQLKAEGITVVIVSHSLDEIFGLADRIAVLYQGNLIDVAETATVNREWLTHMMSTGTRKS